MKILKPRTKDPICGMDVDESSALSANRNGQTFYFCGSRCQKKFIAASASAMPDEKSHGCCE